MARVISAGAKLAENPIGSSVLREPKHRSVSSSSTRVRRAIKKSIPALYDRTVVWICTIASRIPERVEPLIIAAVFVKSENRSRYIRSSKTGRAIEHAIARLHHGRVGASAVVASISEVVNNAICAPIQTHGINRAFA